MADHHLPDVPLTSGAPVHFADRSRSELRPLCGAWGEEIAWSTVAVVVTCPACLRLLRLARARRRRPTPTARPVAGPLTVEVVAPADALRAAALTAESIPAGMAHEGEPALDRGGVGLRVAGDRT